MLNEAADDFLVSYTSLSFKRLFHDSPVVPIQGFDVLHPSSNDGAAAGQIKMGFKIFSRTMGSDHLHPQVRVFHQSLNQISVYNSKTSKA
jgi:hypothetical protein